MTLNLLTQTETACHTVQKTSETLEGTEGEETTQGDSSWHRKVLLLWDAEEKLFGLASILPGQMLSAGLQEWQSLLELVAKPDWERRGRQRYTNSVYPTSSL